MKKLTAIIMCLAMAFSFAACTDNGDSEEKNAEQEVKSTYAEDGIALRVTGADGGEETEFTVEDIEKLGTEKAIYSGRNKKGGNERQIREYEGVDLRKVLKAAGYEDAEKIQITSADGYSSKYNVSELYGLYAFTDKTSSEKIKATPMLIVLEEGEDVGKEQSYSPEKGSPLRLIYGQEDFDSEETKDFNMQGWAYYIEKIEVLE